MINFTILEDNSARPIIAHGLMANIVPLPVGNLELNIIEAEALHKALGNAITNYWYLSEDRIKFEKLEAEWEASHESQNAQKAGTATLEADT